MAFAAYVLHGYFAIAVMLVMPVDGEGGLDTTQIRTSNAQVPFSYRSPSVADIFGNGRITVVPGGDEWLGYFANAINLKWKKTMLLNCSLQSSYEMI